MLKQAGMLDGGMGDCRRRRRRDESMDARMAAPTFRRRRAKKARMVMRRVNASMEASARLAEVRREERGIIDVDDARAVTLCSEVSSSFPFWMEVSVFAEGKC